MDENLFLPDGTARQLYQTAAKLPIVDYHCHLSPKEIYEDAPYQNLTQAWLANDHYKWRLMRNCGIDEEDITGGACDRDKFMAYARCVELAAGHPLYHWSMMELASFFDIPYHLTGENAGEVWEKANKEIREKALSPRKILKRFNVQWLATTDDPADSLEYHQLLQRERGFCTKVTPTFRTDRLLMIRDPGFPEYLRRLSLISGVPIRDFSSLKNAVSRRLDYFCTLGCRFSDVGIEEYPQTPDSGQCTEKTVQAALRGEKLSDAQCRAFLFEMYLFLASEYKRRNITMQLHLAVVRNANACLFRLLGPDCGADCCSDSSPAGSLLPLLNAMEENGGVPRTILYCLHPGMYVPMATAAGCFPNVTLGAAWWFNDHREGIEQQLKLYAQTDCIAGFSGMLTDSRSFLSFVRHDYFRRIFCGLLGDWVDRGEFPNPRGAHEIVRRVCYQNALDLTGGN